MVIVNWLDRLVRRARPLPQGLIRGLIVGISNLACYLVGVLVCIALLVYNLALRRKAELKMLKRVTFYHALGLSLLSVVINAVAVAVVYLVGYFRGLMSLLKKALVQLGVGIAGGISWLLAQIGRYWGRERLNRRERNTRLTRGGNGKG